MMNSYRDVESRTSVRSGSQLAGAAACGAALLLFTCGVSVLTAVGAETAEASLQAEYGVTLALGGRTDEAEEVFVSLLSGDPKHAIALNNLGNLHLIRGDIAVALVFYRVAAQADSTDAGIVLNRSIALMLIGDDAGAGAQALRGLRMAGDVEAARSLLGLPGRDPSAELAKAAGQAFLTKEEVQALLDAAAASVPVDTMAVAPSDTMGVPPDVASEEAVQSTTWRSAGLRASDASELSSLLYWKR